MYQSFGPHLLPEDCFINMKLLVFGSSDVVMWF